MRYPHDEIARRRIRGSEDFERPLCDDADIDLSSNMVVQAGAGSGKTRALVGRMVALVRSGIPPSEIAAITFTVKAAGELRHGFFKQLRKRVKDTQGYLDKEPDNREAWQDELQYLERALRQLDDVFIGTIDSFSGRLLRERPFQAGVSPDYSLLDPSRVGAHRRAFWSRYVAQDPGGQVAELFELGIDPNELLSLFGNTSGLGVVELESADEHPPIPDLSAAVLEAAELVQRAVHEGTTAPREDDMLSRLRSISRFWSHADHENTAQQAELLRRVARLPVEEKKGVVIGKVTVSRWGDKESPSRACAEWLKNAVPLLLDEHVLPALGAWRSYVYPVAARFVASAAQAYEAHRRETGQLGFDDVLRGSKRLLELSAANRRHFQSRFKHILVDEFQDTDPVQAEMLLLLTADDPDQTNPWACRPLPGTLFVVGDDKQSIYRFRGADVDVFRWFTQRILDTGGSLVRLTANFRSDPNICAFINRALPTVFSAEGQALWEDLDPFGEDPSPVAGPQVARLTTPDSVYSYRSHVSKFESPHVARIIQTLVAGNDLALETGELVSLDRPIDWRDILILFRTSKQMGTYAAALTEAGVPFAVSGGKTLHKSEALALLLDPIDAVYKDDPIATVAYLRGPFCGVADNLLLDHVAAGGNLGLLNPDDHGEPEASQSGSPITEGLASLMDLRQRLTSYPPSEAIESWVIDRGILPGLSSFPAGSELAGSLLRILTLIRRWDADGMSWPEVVEELHRLVSKEIEDEQLTLDALEGSAVRLMTVHQAKGLQAPVVILADPYGKVSDRPRPWTSLRRTQGGATLAAKIGDAKHPVAWAPRWQEAEEEELAREALEEVRLAYVAATRAEHLLIVSHFAKQPEGPWSPFGSALASVPAIALDSAAPPVSASDKAFDANVVEAALQEAEKNHEAAAIPTYAYASPSSHDGDFDPGETGEGRGTEYGRLFHRAADLAVRRITRPLTPLEWGATLDRLAAEEVASPRRGERLGQARSELAALMTGEFWVRLSEADQVLAEVPFAYADGTTTVTGYIDLAYQTGDGWTLVDYKTDIADPAGLINRYRDQLEGYRRAWMRLTGARDVTVAIWSAPSAQLVTLE